MSNRQNAVMTRVLGGGKTLSRGFSLIEMMVVLLIISIILAATAPIAAKKMARDMASGASAWIYTNNNGSLGYNVSGKNISAIIGASNYSRGNNGPQFPRLVLAAGDDDQHPALVFANANGAYRSKINVTDTTVTINGGTGDVGANSVAIGLGQTHNGSGGTVAIGKSSQSMANGAIAIGNEAKAFGIHSTAIGISARANSNDSGTGIQGQNNNGIAIGNSAKAKGNASIAIGLGAEANSNGSIAIGNNVKVPATDNEGKDYSNHVWIGGGNYVVDIPGDLAAWKQVWVGGNVNTAGDVHTTGNLTVDGTLSVGTLRVGNLAVTGDLLVQGTTALLGDNYFHIAGGSSGETLKLQTHNNGNFMSARHDNNIERSLFGVGFYESAWSDKRLKNIGEKYISGLEALKKLDIYNFTFKNDKTKTPHVGVIAQDLQKVFPNAVTKGDDGYLRIRWDEMFYAVINAVKELDAKVNDIIAKITNHDSEITALKTEMQNLKNVNSELIIQNQELKKQNAEFEKRLTKLEKKDK